MAFPKPPKITTAIPNNPFYSPQEWQVCGNYLNYVVGCGICVTTDGTITTWDDGCGVCAIVAGPGICTTNTAGVVEISSTGLLALNVGTGLCSTGGTEPLLYLADTGVIPGSYAYPSITVDSKGRVIAAINRPATIRCDVITAKGDLIVGEASQVGTALPIGPNNSVLIADSTCCLGMRWVCDNTGPFIPKCCLPAKGYLVTGSAALNSPIPFAPGPDGCILKTCSSTSSGLIWAAAGGTVADPCNQDGSGELVGSGTRTFVILPNLNPSRCRYYSITVTGDVRTRDGTVGIGDWALCAPPPVDTTVRSVVGYTTSIYPVEQWPIALTYIYENPFPGSPFSVCLCISQNCTGLNAGIRYQWNASSFGF